MTVLIIIFETGISIKCKIKIIHSLFYEFYSIAGFALYMYILYISKGRSVAMDRYYEKVSKLSYTSLYNKITMTVQCFANIFALRHTNKIKNISRHTWKNLNLLFQIYGTIDIDDYF